MARANIPTTTAKNIATYSLIILIFDPTSFPQ
jgi:hypothetical protein